MKKAASSRSDLRSDPLAAAHSQTMTAFEEILRSKLKPVLGAAGLRRIQTEASIVTAVCGGLIIHAPLRRRGRLTLERLEREGPIVAVLANTIPLVDPVTLRALEPGAYAAGIRPLGRKQAAFDFHGTRGAPTLSAIARENEPGTDAGTDDPLIDVDITVGGPDKFVPPGKGTGLPVVLDLEGMLVREAAEAAVAVLTPSVQEHRRHQCSESGARGRRAH